MSSSLPWVNRIEELIADGPVEVNWLIGEVSGLVPPGRAWRMREWMREYAARKKGLNIREHTEITDEAIWAGQRQIVREGIGKLVYRHRARYIVQDGIKYLERAVPERKPRLTWATVDESTRETWRENLRKGNQVSPEMASERVRRAWVTRRRKNSL